MSEFLFVEKIKREKEWDRMEKYKAEMKRIKK